MNNVLLTFNRNVMYIIICINWYEFKNYNGLMSG